MPQTTSGKERKSEQDNRDSMRWYLQPTLVANGMQLIHTQHGQKPLLHGPAQCQEHGRHTTQQQDHYLFLCTEQNRRRMAFSVQLVRKSPRTILRPFLSLMDLRFLLVCENASCGWSASAVLGWQMHWWFWLSYPFHTPSTQTSTFGMNLCQPLFPCHSTDCPGDWCLDPVLRRSSLGTFSRLIRRIRKCCRECKQLQRG